MGGLRHSRSNREPGGLRIRTRLALAASVVLFACDLQIQASAADTTATWSSETSGNWTSTSLWSIAPNIPNNGTPSGADYQALINATGGSEYTVTLDSNIDIDVLTINSVDATLSQTSGTLQAGTINIDAGSYQLNNGASIANSAIDLNSGSFGVQNGQLNGVSVVGGDLNVSNFLFVQNGLTISSHNLNLGSNSAVYFDGPSQSVDNLNVTTNLGTVADVYPSGPNSIGPQTLTLGKNTTVRDDAAFTSYHTGDSLVNNGTLDADSYGSSIIVAVDNFTNNGTAEATNDGQLTIGYTNYIAHDSWSNSATGVIGADASRLSLAGNWSNAGAINATNSSTVDLGGNFGTADVANLDVDSTSAVNISGMVNNSSAILAFKSARAFTLNGSTSPPLMSGVTYSAEINGGAIDNSAGNFVVDFGALNGVSVIGGDLNVSSNGFLYVKNGLTVSSHNLNIGAFGTVYFDGPSQSIDNLNINGLGRQGTVYISGPDSSGPQTLTLGKNIIVNNGVAFDRYQTGDTLINNGIIDADSVDSSVLANGLTISVDQFINNNIIETNNADLDLAFSNFVNHGTISLHSGSITGPAGGLNVGDGTLTGAGTILGNVALSAASTLEFQLRDGADYDSLGIDVGGVSLAGNLEIALADGFTPTSSDTFTVLRLGLELPPHIGHLTGSFLNVADGGSLETTDGTGYFTVYYADSEYPNQIVLTDFQPGTIPEPTCIALLGVGSIGLTLRRRQRKPTSKQPYTNVRGRINRSSVGVSSTIINSAIYGPTATDA
jgi:PEP-CTERM motif